MNYQKLLKELPAAITLAKKKGYTSVELMEENFKIFHSEAVKLNLEVILALEEGKNPILHFDDDTKRFIIQ